MSPQKKSYLYILTAAALWGSIGVFTQYLSACGLSSLELVSIRAVGSAVFLAILYGFKSASLFRIRLRHIGYFVGTGILSFVFFNWCYFNCIQQCSLSIAVVLLYTAPAFVVIMSALLFHEAFTGRKLLALLLTFAGCILVTGISTGNITGFGFLLGIGSGFGYALYSIFGRYALKHYEPETITLYTYVFASIGVLPFISPAHTVKTLMSPPALLSAAGLIFFASMIPMIFYTRGLTHLETGKASIAATLEPVVASIISILVFGETFTLPRLLGIALVISSVILMRD